MTSSCAQVATHSVWFLDMPDAAFNGVLLELFHDATVDHARHMFVHRPLRARVDKGSLPDSDADPIAALGWKWRAGRDFKIVKPG
jgi:hypothetical protein